MNQNDTIPANITLSYKEISAIFSEIDDQITALHECSSEDFLAFNAYLKQHFGDIKIIAENIDYVHNTVAEKSETPIIRHLSDFYDNLLRHTQAHFKHLEAKAHILEQQLNYLNFTLVPLKNLHHNVVTMKFLVTNLRLHAALSVNKRHDSLNDLENFIRLADNLRLNIPVLEDDLFQLKRNMKNILLRFTKISSRLMVSVNNSLEQLHANMDYLRDKNRDTLRRLPDLQQCVEHSFNSVNHIITNLQYHDIIRQRMEHIQSSYKTFMLQWADKQIIDTDDKGYVQQIPHIVQLQIAQLLHTNKDYQRAIQDIITRFLEISRDMTEALDICMYLAGNRQNTDISPMRTIENPLQHSVAILYEFTQSAQKFLNNVQTIHYDVQRVEQSSVSVFSMCNTLLKLWNNIEPTMTNVNPETDSILIQITTIASDITQNIEQTNNCFKQATRLHDKNSVQYDTDFSPLMLQAQELLSSINSGNKQVLDYLQNSAELSNNIARQIKKSIEEVKYYAFFEKIVEKIIFELNTIYQNIVAQYPELSGAKQSVNQVEHLYTMKIERVIHNRVVSDKNISPENIINNIQNDDQDESIEFFE